MARRPLAWFALAASVALLLGGAWFWRGRTAPQPELPARAPIWEPRRSVDTAGFYRLVEAMPKWPSHTSLPEVADLWRGAARETLARIERDEAEKPSSVGEQMDRAILKAGLWNYEGEPEKAYEVLSQARTLAGETGVDAELWKYTLVYFQGVTALRIGETKNCIHCRGESSCILPIVPSAQHQFPEGSRQAIAHFTEYLGQFPDDLEVRWLLNLAHMTLGEYPAGVDPRYLVPLDFQSDEPKGIGRFRDVADRVGLNRLNQSGGAVMDDFDRDGLLDLAVTVIDPTEPMSLFRSRGDGTFEDVAAKAGLAGQLGGLYCVQTDFNNDGFTDLFIPRGAWLESPIRPSLLVNNGDGTFSDATDSAGLEAAANSITAQWADVDNDGALDLFVCCERQPSRLYRNRGDGTFDERAAESGLLQAGLVHPKGAAWIDADNDDFPDLFVNDLLGLARFFHNEGDGTFRDASRDWGVFGPEMGFSCWSWDYDNDGWMDMFATSYDRTLADGVRGLFGQSHLRQTSRLFRNKQGMGFEDVASKAGLDQVYAAMGSNFTDLDNDGLLDFYLGTGDPNLGMLLPNRLFHNRKDRFQEITWSSGTGHLQKGHAVACGDWDRDGDNDVFIQMGGATPGDAFHNLLFENPGHGRHWLSLRLVGRQTNRAAVGVRIKVVSADPDSLVVHRHVSSGSSFGANPLEQSIGLGPNARVARLEVHWPASGATQVFENLAADQSLVICEFDSTPHAVRHPRLVPPAAAPQAPPSSPDGNQTQTTNR